MYQPEGLEILLSAVFLFSLHKIQLNILRSADNFTYFLWIICKFLVKMEAPSENIFNPLCSSFNFNLTDFSSILSSSMNPRSIIILD